jgi:membrane protein
MEPHGHAHASGPFRPATEAPSIDEHASRRARHPRARVWRPALVRLWHRFQNDNIDILAGGVALFAVLSLMPALAATVSIYGLLSNPADIRAQVEPLAQLVPPEVIQLVVQQLSTAAQGSHRALGVATAVSVLLALFSAVGGLRALMSAFNVVHRYPERRSWLHRNLLALALGAAAIIVVMVAVGLVVVLPTVLALVHLGSSASLIVSWGRWPALFLLVMTGLMVLYRLGPVRGPRRVGAGAALATLIWMAASVGLSVYVDRVANYSGLYGAFGAALVVLLWFYVSALVVLLGAVLSQELHEARWRAAAHEL